MDLLEVVSRAVLKALLALHLPLTSYCIITPLTLSAYKDLLSFNVANRQL